VYLSYCYVTAHQSVDPRTLSPTRCGCVDGAPRRAAPPMRADEERAGRAGDAMRCDARVVDGGEGGLRVEDGARD
jgi:hypothetical protein